MTNPFIRTRFTWIAYFLLALYAYFLNIPGAITTFLRDEFQMSYTVSSLHFSAFAVGILAAGAAGPVVIRRIGRSRALAVGALGVGAGALLLAAGRSPAATIGAIFLMGCVGSLILAVVPAALADEHGEMRAVAISEANVLSSLISALAPVFVGQLAARQLNWRWALILAALPLLALGASMLRGGQAQAARAEPEPAGRKLPGLYWAYWITLVMAVSVEFCMVYWCAAYMQNQLHMPPAGAAQTASLFLGGMILGRLASSRLLRYFPARAVVLASLILGCVGFAIFWSTSSVAAGMAGLALTGLGVAGLYPLILSMAIGAARGSEAQAGARATLASGAAILALPLALGRLADMAGLRPAFAVVAVMFAGMLVMMALTRRRHQAATAASRP